MMPPTRFLLAAGLLALLARAGVAQAPPAKSPTAAPAVPTELFDYVARPEPEFRCEPAGSTTTDAGTIHAFRLTSQVWRGIAWTHDLRVYEPAKVEHPGLMLLFITGGAVGRTASESDHEQGFALARACGGRVAVLPQVPNQPLMGGKVEDDLIGETFVNYLKSGEPDWPLLLPMVKSAVKAMDALQAWGKERGQPIAGFVVTGASKRGWTTWLTGAADPRVKAIAPMVIPTLNMRAQSKHQLDSWGTHSEQIEDYTRRGLTEQFDTPAGRKLWTIVDPFTYLDRVKVPVLQINGGNDRYWTVDSVNIFWDDISAPWKGLVILPNAGHGLDQNREWAIEGVGALFRATATGQRLPQVRPLDGPEPGLDKPDHALRVALPADDPTPTGVRLWTARSRTRDFREASWTPEAYPGARGPGELSAAVDLDGHPFAAAFLELTYDMKGFTYHLASPVRVFDANGEVRPQLEAAPAAGAAGRAAP